jgi:hypothetical protein
VLVVAVVVLHLPTEQTVLELLVVTAAQDLMLQHLEAKAQRQPSTAVVAVAAVRQAARAARAAAAIVAAQVQQTQAAVVAETMPQVATTAEQAVQVLCS